MSNDKASHFTPTNPSANVWDNEDDSNLDSADVEMNLDDFVDDGYSFEQLDDGSMSIAPSILDHAFEHGRRYHKFREGTYDIKHAMVVNTCDGKLHFAPIGKHPQNILDLGTGTGTWCMEMGDLYPSASILGIDLSPIQSEWVPPNVRFMVDDVESSWLESENFYDLVHGRHITPAIKDFPALIRRAYSHIKPGGFLEFQEMEPFPYSDDSSLLPTSPLLKYYTSIHLGLKNLGVDLERSRDELTKLSSYNFINTQHEILKIPIGTWSETKMMKTVGMYGRVGIIEGLQAMALGPLCKGLGWSKEDVVTMCEDVKKYLSERK
ncbi:S-adenosyl-L-methionine-dependent methyltransferase [Mollisia scopiformis]|uniref:S-adenosyl-L-methionine-dependent methyltransferase n=1 Tax=Mollisia scopiformis TaxID=149040 RepID=A0A194X515_MOLSC|nr:S-adenosyl-L-methionine-dependent methyltransferase [Mollisia scopiformis]KUJ15270.1 S-adenosyl-L-methionine-dependent methyltransferase [Mollisia scopiformis]